MVHVQKVKMVLGIFAFVELDGKTKTAANVCPIGIVQIKEMMPVKNLMNVIVLMGLIVRIPYVL